MTTEKEEQRALADKILKSIEEAYGFVPLVNQVLSERPDLFIPSSGIGRAALEGKDKVLDSKMSYLCAVSAATAIGAEHCARVQTTHAKAAGATREEVLEAMFIGSYMSMTKSQSYALRVFRDVYGEKEE